MSRSVTMPADPDAVAVDNQGPEHFVSHSGARGL